MRSISPRACLGDMYAGVPSTAPAGGPATWRLPVFPGLRSPRRRACFRLFGWRGESVPIINPEIIREYDIRGVADRDFSDETCRTLGRAIGTFERRHGKRRITLGRDARLHSPRIRDAVLAGLLECGLRHLFRSQHTDAISSFC